MVSLVVVCTHRRKLTTRSVSRENDDVHCSTHNVQQDIGEVKDTHDPVAEFSTN